MKRFSEWQKESIGEGINPTDIDSSGMDQDLDNTGVPFDMDAFNKVTMTDRERDELDREYQKKIFDLMKLGDSQDPSDIDPTKGPEGETTGGTVDQAIHDFLSGKNQAMKKWGDKYTREREDVPVNMPSTAFIQDKKKFFTPRTDTFAPGGNADKSSDVIDQEKTA